MERISRAGVAIEINTAGLHKPVKEAYPSPAILRKLWAAGIPITFGSDAHRPEEVGRDFAHATGLARAAGYQEFATLDADPAGGRASLRQTPFPAPEADRPDAPRGAGSVAGRP